MSKREQVIEKIRQAGIVGAGGAGFPTHVKVNCDAEYVIVNCAECEPLIKSDKYLMEQHAAEIVEGLEAAMSCTNATKGVLAVKAHNEAAVDALQAAVSGKDALSVHLLENYYPAGDEQQIIYEVTHRTIQVGALPSSVGCVVINAQTAYQISKAMQDEVVTSRNVTITGEVEHPVTLTAPIGTAVTYLIELAGGTTVDDYVIVIGGPLMGRVADNPEAEFVTKTTNGVIVLPKDHPLIAKKTDDLAHQYKIAKSACCQCNYCTLICPRSNLGLGVQPHRVMQALTLENSEVMLDGKAALGCCNCGLCTYVGCNMGLSPGRFVNAMRQDLLAKKVKCTDQPGPINVFRNESKTPSSRVIQRMSLSKYDDREVDFLSSYEEPRAVRILMSQHTGAPCKPLVEKGQMVSKGQCVGEIPEGALGGLVHASIEGQVVSVCPEYVDILKG